MLERRQFIKGLVAFVAAPAIVRATNIMPVKMMNLDDYAIWQFGDVSQVYGRSPMLDALPSIWIGMWNGVPIYEARDGIQLLGQSAVDRWAELRAIR